MACAFLALLIYQLESWKRILTEDAALPGAALEFRFH